MSTYIQAHFCIEGKTFPAYYIPCETAVDLALYYPDWTPRGDLNYAQRNFLDDLLKADPDAPAQQTNWCVSVDNTACVPLPTKKRSIVAGCVNCFVAGFHGKRVDECAEDIKNAPPAGKILLGSVAVGGLGLGLGLAFLFAHLKK